MSLNRYICQTVLPLLTRNAKLFDGAADSNSNLIETFLFLIYRFYRIKTLSNAQKATITGFLSHSIQFVKPQTIYNFLVTLSQHLCELEPFTEVAYDVSSILRNYYL